MSDIAVLGLVGVSLVAVFWLCKFLKNRHQINIDFKELKERFEKLQAAKISSEVRTGAIGEQLAPFLTDWPFSDPKTFRAIGGVIDGINFDESGITLIEIKTGNAKLSKQQKMVKHHVENGNIKFLEFRIEPSGVKIKETFIKNNVNFQDDCFDAD